MLRVTVRILGLVLLVIGAVIWSLEYPGTKPANASAPTVVSLPTRAVPTHPKSRSTRASVSPIPTAATIPSVATVPVPENPSAPRSTVELRVAFKDTYSFVSHLYKSDGWFDTGIPITPDVKLRFKCNVENPLPPYCKSFVQFEVGTTVIPPLPPYEVPDNKPYVTRTASEQPPPEELTVLIGPEPQTLKLRILPEAKADDIALKFVLGVVPLDGRKELTAVQQQENQVLGSIPIK